MNTLKRDYIWNTIGVLLQNAISPLLLIFVTRINGIDDSGVFSFAFSIAIAFWVIAMWGGRTYQVSDVTHRFMRQSYVFMRMILSVIILILAYLFCWINGYDTEKTIILMSLVVVRIFETLSDVYYGVMQSERQLHVTGKLMAIKYIVASLIFGLVDITTGSLVLSCMSFVAVTGLSLFVLDIPFAKRVDRSITRGLLSKKVFKESRSLLRILAPVFLVSFFLMLALNIPRYFIDMYHQSEIGYFGILAMPVTLIVLMMTLILQPNVVRLSELYQQKNMKEFNGQVLRIAGVTLGVGVVTLALTAFIGVPSLELVFGIPFDDYYAALIIVVVASIVNALVSVLMNLLVITRVFKPQAVTLIVTNMLLLSASLLFINAGGVVMAMTLFLATNVIQLIALCTIYVRTISAVK